MRVIGLQQIQHITFVPAGRISKKCLHRIGRGSGRQFDPIRKILVVVQILRTDPIGKPQDRCAVLRARQILPADTVKFERIVHFCDFLLMGNQIVMELPRRAIVETAAVCQQIELFPMRVAPAAKPLKCGNIPIELAFCVKRSEAIAQIVHAFFRADLHIDRCANLKLREIFTHKATNHRRCRRHRDEVHLLTQIVDKVASCLKKAPRKALPAIAVGIQKQIQPDACIRDSLELVALPLCGLPREKILVQTDCASSTRHSVP